MNTELKIKALSLGAECRIIRAQENRLARRLAKARGRAAVEQWLAGDKRLAGIAREEGTFASLHNHRMVVVRREARATHLARGFLKGTAYRDMEHACWEQPIWDRVREIAVKYRPGDHSEQVIRQRFAEWRDAAGEWKLPRVGPRVPRPRVSKGDPEAKAG